VTTLPPLSVADWRALAHRDPAAAAREVHRRVAALLSPAQQRACLAAVVDEAPLAAAFAAAPANAPLAGVPYFLKDLFDLAGYPTRAGSSFLADVRPVPASDAALVQALRAVGAVCAGKTHLHEFAYGITGENPHYGDCEHPHFPGRTTGGSSSGSAAVVAAGIVPFAIGTDTGGSVRTPAAFCGLYGFRMTPGHAWIADAFPLAPSCDTAGWLTRTPADLLEVNGALLGLGTSRREPRGCYLESASSTPTWRRPAAKPLRGFAHRRTTPRTDNWPTPSRGPRLPISCSRAPKPPASTPIGSIPIGRNTARPSGSVSTAAGIGSRANRSPPRCAAVSSATRSPAIFSPSISSCFPRRRARRSLKAECDQSHRERVLTLSAPASLAGLPVLSAPVPLPSGLTAGLQVIVNSVQSPVIPWALQRL
jgi:aspartyl-tRNA(Asn)/glutamyl-tRNA(Gln) amidotransferase subunit A